MTCQIAITRCLLMSYLYQHRVSPWILTRLTFKRHNIMFTPSTGSRSIWLLIRENFMSRCLFIYSLNVKFIISFRGNHHSSMLLLTHLMYYFLCYLMFMGYLFLTTFFSATGASSKWAHTSALCMKLIIKNSRSGRTSRALILRRWGHMDHCLLFWLYFWFFNLFV